MVSPSALFHVALSPRLVLPAIAVTAVTALAVAAPPASADPSEAPSAATAGEDGRDDLLRNVRQLTFEGRRAGEGYFSPDGQRMVFQSERAADNPFYQIYTLDLTTGDTQRISPGIGKTTCGWIGPDGRVLYASTEHDPDALAKQQAELEFRASGKERRYSWDYDPEYDLYLRDADGSNPRRLDDGYGYDAEGSISPDGRTIVFASNRAAYVDGEPRDEATAEKLAIDPSYFIDLYRINVDGTGLVRLTETPGYDGGPFFSPDGSRLCWRRFSEDGTTAEIYTANLDGTDVRRLTRSGAMSWAPFYHPSGDYLIYTTNLNGFANFELYLVDAAGEAGDQPVRVTTTEGFDGLPVFTPDGRSLAWTSNRTAAERSQIFLGEWNHELALERLAAARMKGSVTDQPHPPAARPAQFAPADIARRIEALTAPEMAGRRTGTDGERLAAAYIADEFAALGLKPAGSEGFRDPFSFTSGVRIEDGGTLSLETSQPEGAAEQTAALQLDRDFRPLAFSASGTFEAAPVVFAGYGIQAPDSPDGSVAGYDSFVHLDVTDKWVLAFRFLPEDLTPERRQHLARYSSLRRKAMLARDLGAKGLLIASGPNSRVRRELVSLGFDGSIAGTSIPVISITDDLARQLLDKTPGEFQVLQTELDTGEPAMGGLLENRRVAADFRIVQEENTGTNVLARLQVGETPTNDVLVIGAHLDHLGVGGGGSSLAREDERDRVHQGADDNASGVAAMLAIAQSLAADPKRSDFQRDVVFAAWSGEELGLLGSADWAEQHVAKHPHDAGKWQVVANLNLDMVGRYETALVVQGVGSSDEWPGLIERANVPVGLPLTLSADAYLPTDASEFYKRGVPILSAFTGTHEDYHTPRDTADRINHEGAARAAHLFALLARRITLAEEPPTYREQQAPKESERRANLRAYLGTIPDYAQTDEPGVALSGVAKGGPAAAAGVQGGDVIVELAGRTIENIYDYTFAIEALKIGEEVTIVVTRGGKRVTLKITPGSRG